MIKMAIASAIYLVGMQAGITAPRAAFVECLKQASKQAQSDKIAGETYADYARGRCTSQAQSLKSALVSFDVKNGIARKQASSDSDLQIDDYLQTSLGHYQMLATPASAPK